MFPIAGFIVAVSLMIIAIVNTHTTVELEDTFHLYQTTKTRIAEIDAQMEQLKTHPDPGLQTSPLRQERVFICSKLYHAVSFYNLAPERLKQDKYLPQKLDVNFCLSRK